MPVLLAALKEAPRINAVALPVIEHAAFSAPVHTITLEIAKMGTVKAGPEASAACDMNLHHDAAHMQA